LVMLFVTYHPHWLPSFCHLLNTGTAEVISHMLIGG
jgi:hypothetical protein